jgi:hypothetical protein
VIPNTRDVTEVLALITRDLINWHFMTFYQMRPAIKQKICSFLIFSLSNEQLKI